MNLKKEIIDPNEMKIKDEHFLQGMTQAAAEEIEYNTMGAFQTSEDKVLMKHFYHIIYDPDLGEGFCAMR